MCVQYLQKPDPSRAKKSQQKEMLGVEKCSVCTAERSQIKGRNSCVYFAEVRTDLKRPPPLGVRLVGGGGGRHPEDYHLQHRTKCNLQPIIHKQKLRQRYPVENRWRHNIRFRLRPRLLFPLSRATDFYAQLPIWTASEGTAAGAKKQKIPLHHISWNLHRLHN